MNKSPHFSHILVVSLFIPSVYGRYMLCNFGLSPMKDEKCKRNLVISWVVATKWCSYDALREKFKDCCCQGLLTKDSLTESQKNDDGIINLGLPSHNVTATMTYFYQPTNRNAAWNNATLTPNPNVSV